MISIIVCSKNTADLKKFTDNLQQTIGLNYELIAFQNSLSQIGICQAYNKGIQKANYNILCFCHEDIVFNTNGWGSLLVSLLQNESIGLAGVAGALYKSKTPGSWANIPPEYYRVNLIQEKKDGAKEIFMKTDKSSYSEVAVLDGCFIAGKKNVFEQYPWNESFLKGFHLYDIDISRRVGEQFKLVVSNQIAVTHFSEGLMNNDWLQESERYHRKYSKHFPLHIASLKKKEMKELEYHAHYRYVLLLIRFKRSLFKILSTILKGFALAPGKRENLSLLKQCFLRRR